MPTEVAHDYRDESVRRTDPAVDQDEEVARNRRVLAQIVSALLKSAPSEATPFRPYAGMMTGEPGGGQLASSLIALGELLNESAEFLTQADVERVGQTGMLIDVAQMATDETVMADETKRTRARLIAFRRTDHLPRTRTPVVIGTVAAKNPRGLTRLVNIVVLENGTVCAPTEPIGL